MPANGLVIMTPTSIASTGTGNSSSINAKGSVSFSSCATLSLNGVFNSSYDIYKIVLRDNSSSNVQYQFRMRASGTDATGANYYWQYLQGDGGTVSSARTSADTYGWLGYSSNTLRSGSVAYVFSPNLSESTTVRAQAAVGANNGRVMIMMSRHTLASSYDGITIIPVSPVTFSGLITVYGFNK